MVLTSALVGYLPCFFKRVAHRERQEFFHYSFAPRRRHATRSTASFLAAPIGFNSMKLWDPRSLHTHTQSRLTRIPHFNVLARSRALD